MRGRRYGKRGKAIALVGCGLLCLAVQARGEAGDLPNAPSAPQSQGAVTPKPPIIANATGNEWAGVIEPNMKAAPLSVREKLLFAGHEELRWTSLVTVVFSGGYGILRDNDPHFGINREGFGERVGAAALRQSIGRELSDSLLPIIFHEDPRYYRQAYGSVKTRGLYAASRAFITRTDSGAPTVDLSDLLGTGMNAALTQTYYPQSSIGTGVVLSTWAISLAQQSGFNLFAEFWPDLKHKLFHGKL